MMAAVRIWILLSALLVASGWTLSALHQLNRTGYGFVFALTLGAALIWRQKTGWRPKSFRQFAHQFQRRFRRPAPMLFLALALMALAAGALYLPSGESNAYRIPRVLHWLGQEQWHWIRAADARLNIAGCGFEWLSAPTILFLRTDRFQFLINWISYLLLPGLIFSLFTRLQVRPRVAWWWMWLLPSGWCYIFQASSGANDSFAAVYALAAVVLALRWRETGKVADLWLSLLAAALLTGTKQTSIPLVALWLIAVLPGFRQTFLFPRRTLAVAALGLLVSAVPLIILNLNHTGNWLGIVKPNEGTLSWGGWSNTVMDTPFWGIIGNAFCLTAQNFKPPFFPVAASWNAEMENFLQTPFGAHFRSFEHFGLLDQGLGENSAGIGLGICLITLVSWCMAQRLKRTQVFSETPMADRTAAWLRIAPWALLLLFMASVGTYQNARQLAPYYVFFFPALLRPPVQSAVVRRVSWQRLACLAMLFTVLLLVVSRTAPLFPAQTLFARLQEKYPQSKAIEHLAVSYSAPLTLETARTPFPSDLPAGETLIGYCIDTGGDEPGLWFPLGFRRVVRVQPDDTSEQLRALQLHYIVVDGFSLSVFHQTIEQWLTQHDAQLLKQTALNFKFGMPASYLYLVRLR